jgi:hypothetical protein
MELVSLVHRELNHKRWSHQNNAWDTMMGTNVSHEGLAFYFYQLSGFFKHRYQLIVF